MRGTTITTTPAACRCTRDAADDTTTNSSRQYRTSARPSLLCTPPPLQRRSARILVIPRFTRAGRIRLVFELEKESARPGKEEGCGIPYANGVSAAHSDENLRRVMGDLRRLMCQARRMSVMSVQVRRKPELSHLIRDPSDAPACSFLPFLRPPSCALRTVADNEEVQPVNIGTDTDIIQVNRLRWTTATVGSQRCTAAVPRIWRPSSHFIKPPDSVVPRYLCATPNRYFWRPSTAGSSLDLSGGQFSGNGEDAKDCDRRDMAGGEILKIRDLNLARVVLNIQVVRFEVSDARVYEVYSVAPPGLPGVNISLDDPVQV
ncbi:hypothetical protein B0H16DRAFT_1810506 [Mycena metata]|uniref:Uncharacterized protein n=1 Tax=Mycena metata TaxID=1033252 RepID=A0AAD7H6T4_9AGAR|nr:hypothetical protein B0H16DRAFT_1810506 [Mycena metata]